MIDCQKRIIDYELSSVYFPQSPNAHDQIALYSVHSFLVEVQMKMATYLRRMHNSNLQIKIVGNNPCPTLSEKSASAPEY